MPIPATYDEAAIAEYMDDVLGDTASVLGLSVAAGDYNEAVIQVLIKLGTETPETLVSLADRAKIRALARVEAWRHVVNVTAGEYDFKADGGQYNRSQIHAMAKENLAAAISDASRYDSEYQIRLGKLTHKHDPYVYLPEDERTP